MLALFTLTIFLGAALLFAVQPMAARMLLPQLGGSPAVWNTSMVFFQAALLAGYAYAHWSVRILGPRRQAILHAVLLLAPLPLLPILLPDWQPPRTGSPIPWLLAVLCITVGPFFLVISTGAPLLQRWFATTPHPAAKDPYFLYAASNAGSLLALLSYPILVEPNATLGRQWSLWSAGYILLVVLTLACAGIVLRAGRGTPRDEDHLAQAVPKAAPLARGRRAGWLLLAFIPSSLMLGVTQFLSTDIAAIPLLWVVPLTIYLLTFILAFARRPPFSLSLLSWTLPPIAVGMALFSFLAAPVPVWIVIGIQLAGLFVASLLCHGRLAAQRPDPSRLTDFYLMLAIGGVLGGVFSSIVAPLVFNVIAEFPIAIVLACLVRLPVRLRLPAALDIPSRALDVAGPALLIGLFFAIPWALSITAYGARTVSMLQYVLVGAACLALIHRRVGFALGLGVLMTLGQLGLDSDHRKLHVERTFFGVHRVVEEPTGTWRALMHGITEHGRQATPPEARRIPTMYYHPGGPIGDVFRAMFADPAFDHIAIVGLGAGTLAAYAEDYQRYDFYEIDPAVERIAENPALFTYLPDARERGATVNIVLGDARLRIAEARDGLYDLIILDAFSSDAIPVHLITREAFELYLTKLRSGGIIAVHISNKYVNLAPVLASAARELGMVCAVRYDGPPMTPEEAGQGKVYSVWAILARKTDPLDLVFDIAMTQKWGEVLPPQGRAARVWTDDYSDVLSVFRWK